MPPTDPSQESWGAYLNRQVAERAEQIGSMELGIDKLQENSAGWAEETSKWAGRQKRNLLFGALKKGAGI